MIRLGAFLFGFLLLPTLAAGDVCMPDTTTLCLNHGRFRAEVSWTEATGQQGKAQMAAAGSDDSGVLWFFDPTNWEMLLKVLDGCSLNQHFWVFSSATTNVGYKLTVTDTLTGEQKAYINPVNKTALPVTDTSAFSGCGTAPASSAAARSAAVSHRAPGLSSAAATSAASAGGDTLASLVKGRFAVSVNWTDFQGNSGQGHLAPSSSDDSALFWFFDSSNFELLLKVLNGCGVNDRYWFFAATDTTVQYVLTVTDLYTGTTKQYTHASGDPPLVTLDTDALSVCSTTAPPTVALTTSRFLVLNGHGDTAQVSAVVTDPAGNPLPSAVVQWASSHPEAVSITPTGPQSATITALQSPPAAASITASYLFSQDTAGVAVVALAQGAVLVDGSAIQTRTATSVTLAASPGLTSLAVGNVLVSRDLSGLLSRVTAVSSSSSGVTAQIVPAKLSDAFTALVLPPPVSATGALTSTGAARWIRPANDDAGLTCTLDGGASFTPQVSSFDIEPPTVVATPKVTGNPPQISLTGTLSMSVTVGEIDFGPEVQGGFTCTKSAGHLVLPVWCSAVLCLGPSFDLEIGFSGDVEASGPTLHLSGPTGELDAKFTTALTWIQGSGWRTSGNLTWSQPTLHLATFELQPAAVTSSLKLFGSLDLGIEGSLGLGPFAVNIGDVNFLTLEFGGYVDLSLASPFRPGTPGYRGPSWDLGAYAEADLEADLSSGLLKEIADTLGVETTFLGPQTFFSAKFPLLASPAITVSATPSTLDLANGQPMKLTAAADTGASGSIQFLDQAASQGDPQDLLTAQLNSGNASVNWQPTAAQAGQHVVSALAVTDWLSQILPYGSANSVAVTVQAQRTGGGGTAPTITTVQPNPVPGSASPEILTVLGTNFAAGMTATLTNETTSQTYPSLPLTVASPSRSTLSANLSNLDSRWAIQIVGPSQQTSNSFAFTVQAPAALAPAITGMTPSPVVPSGVAQTLQLSGTGFASGATITLADLTDGTSVPGLSATVASSGQLSFAMSFGRMNVSWTATVVNPDGTASNGWPFQVQVPSAAPVPLISAVAPNPVIGSGASQTLTVQGVNFLAGLVATLQDLTHGGAPASVLATVQSATQLTLSYAFPSAQASWSITVSNPDGTPSNPYSFQVQATAAGKGSMTVTPPSFAFASAVNGNPAVIGLAIGSSTGTTLSGSITAHTTSGGSWLTVNGHPSVTWTSPESVTITATLTGLGAGSYSGSLALTSSNASNSPLTVPVSLTITNVLTIATTSLPDAVSNQPYSTQLAAVGGNGSYSWSLQQGSLPDGLQLGSGGLISGTPGAIGSSTTRTFTAGVQDTAGHLASRSLSMVWRPGLSITDNVGSNFVFFVGVPYSTANSITYQAVGGEAPFSWSASGLPPGLSIGATSGVLQGTPTAPGSYPAQITVGDALAETGTLSAVLAVQTSSLVITDASGHTPPNPPAATLGHSYQFALEAAGGSSSGYTWSTQGSLPPGLTGQNSPGCPASCGFFLTGTPSQAGTFSFGVTVHDSLGNSTAQPLTVAVDSGTPPTITTTRLPESTIGSPYSTALVATGGTPPYSWSFVGSTPDPSVGLSPAGTLSGTTTLANDCPTGATNGGGVWVGAQYPTTYFTVKTTDAAGQSSTLQLCLVSYYPQPVITGYSPTSVVADGVQQYTVTLEGMNFRSGAVVVEEGSGNLPTTFLSPTAVTLDLAYPGASSFLSCPLQAMPGGHSVCEGSFSAEVMQPYSINSGVVGGFSIYDPPPVVQSVAAYFNNSTQPCVVNAGCELVLQGSGFNFNSTFTVVETGTTLSRLANPPTPPPFSTETVGLFTPTASGTYTLRVTNAFQPGVGTASTDIAFSVQP